MSTMIFLLLAVLADDHRAPSQDDVIDVDVCFLGLHIELDDIQFVWQSHFVELVALGFEIGFEGGDALDF